MRLTLDQMAAKPKKLSLDEMASKPKGKKQPSLASRAGSLAKTLLGGPSAGSGPGYTPQQAMMPQPPARSLNVQSPAAAFTTAPAEPPWSAAFRPTPKKQMPVTLNAPVDPNAFQLREPSSREGLLMGLFTLASGGAAPVLSALASKPGVVGKGAQTVSKAMQAPGAKGLAARTGVRAGAGATENVAFDVLARPGEIAQDPSLLTTSALFGGVAAPVMGGLGEFFARTATPPTSAPRMAEKPPVPLRGYDVPGVPPGVRQGLLAEKPVVQKSGTTEPLAKPKVREPWEMTREEWAQNQIPAVAAKSSAAWQVEVRERAKVRDEHRKSVESVLREGKPVPAEVLADYPDLAAKYAPAKPAPPAPKVAERAKVTATDGGGRTRKTPDEVMDDVLQEFADNPEQPQSWNIVPAARVKKIWNDYVSSGIVRDEAGIDAIADQMIENTYRLKANTELAGHTERSGMDIAAERGYNFSEELFDDKFPDHITDPATGQWRLSDYALDKLMDDARALQKAATAEEKLGIIDRMLNRVHQRADIAAYYIEGGKKTLDELSGNAPTPPTAPDGGTVVPPPAKPPTKVAPGADLPRPSGETGISRARIEAQRDALGLGPIEVKPFRVKEKLYTDAKTAIDLGKLNIDAVAKRVMDDPGSARPEELAGFKYRLDQIKEAMPQADAKQKTALLDKQDMLFHAARRAGRATFAETGQALQLVQTADDLGDIASVLQLARDNKGRALVLPEIDRITDYQGKYTALLKEYEALQKQKAASRTPRIVKQAADFKQDWGASNTVFTREGLEAARARMREKASRASAGIDPTMVADLAYEVAYHAEAGVRFSYALFHEYAKKEYNVSDAEIAKAYQQGMNDKRLAGAKARAQTTLGELQAGKQRPKAPPIKYDRELIKLREEVAEAREKLMKEIAPGFDMLEARQRLFGLLNAPTGWIAGFDNSFLLRQGLPMLAIRPKAWAAGAKASHKAMASEGVALMIDDNIMSHPSYPLAQQSGLAHTSIEVDKPLATAEEVAMYMRAFGKSVPGIGKLTRPFERAYTTAANVMRHEAFYKMADANRDVWTDLDFKRYAEFLNIWTGRGDIGRLAALQPELNALFISPRKVASDFQKFTVPFTTKDSPAVRAEAAKALVRYTGALVSLALLVNASGKAKVGLNPDDKSTFLKLRVGNTRFDLTGGAGQALSAVWATGKAVMTHSRLAAKKAGPYDPTPSETVLRYLSSKFAPGAQFIKSAVTGRDFKGDPVTVGQAAKEIAVPWNAQDVWEAWKEEGAGMAAVTAGSAFYGIGAQTYEDRPANKMEDVFKGQKPVLRELQQIGVSFGRPMGYFQSGGKRVDLTEQEYAQYSKAYWQATQKATLAARTRADYRRADADGKKAIVEQAVEDARRKVRNTWRAKKGLPQTGGVATPYRLP